jgi:hypothetical protein
MIIPIKNLKAMTGDKIFSDKTKFSGAHSTAYSTKYFTDMITASRKDEETVCRSGNIQVRAAWRVSVVTESRLQIKKKWVNF